MCSGRYFFNKNNKTSQIELRHSSLQSKFNSRKIEPGSIELYIFNQAVVFAETRQLLGVIESYTQEYLHFYQR